jgi:hypothetical protein
MEMASSELFALAGLKSQFSRSQPPTWLGLQVWATGTCLSLSIYLSLFLYPYLSIIYLSVYRSTYHLSCSNREWTQANTPPLEIHSQIFFDRVSCSLCLG